MMSDSRIVAHVLNSAIRTFAKPRNRRELAQRLRNIRNTTGRRAALLVLADLSARNIAALVK